MLTQQAIKEAADRIVAAASSPGKVIVFGSCGRGDAKEGLDWDRGVVDRRGPGVCDRDRLRVGARGTRHSRSGRRVPGDRRVRHVWHRAA